MIKYGIIDTTKDAKIAPITPTAAGKNKLKYTKTIA
jgi:hypothetical protein